MSIWFAQPSLEQLNARGKNTMAEYLGIEFIEIAHDYLQARMSVDHRTHQPLGIMNGGASCVLAETVGSTAANFCVDPLEYYCVGLDINTNHLRPVQQGFVVGCARPFHIGHKTQVWGIEITAEHGKLISVSRLTMAVLKKGSL